MKNMKEIQKKVLIIIDRDKHDFYHLEHLMSTHETKVFQAILRYDLARTSGKNLSNIATHSMFTHFK